MEATHRNLLSFWDALSQKYTTDRWFGRLSTCPTKEWVKRFQPTVWNNSFHFHVYVHKKPFHARENPVSIPPDREKIYYRRSGENSTSWHAAIPFLQKSILFVLWENYQYMNHQFCERCERWVQIINSKVL